MKLTFALSTIALGALITLSSCEEPPAPTQQPVRTADVQQEFESTATRTQSALEQIHGEAVSDDIPTSREELRDEEPTP